MKSSVPGLTLDERMDTASESDTPASVLEELAEANNWRIRERVAMNNNAPESLLAKLARDERCACSLFGCDQPEHTRPCAGEAGVR